MATSHVFIVGCGRTGSSLIRDLLNRSTNMCISPETHFLRRFSVMGAKKLLGRLGDLRHEHNVDQLIDFLYAVDKRRSSSYWMFLRKHVERSEFKRRLMESDRSERGLFEVLMQLYADRRGSSDPHLILGEKTPTHLYYVPTLLEWFPQAKVVHSFRDPRAIFASRFKKVNQGRDGLRIKYAAMPQLMLQRCVGPVETLYVTRAWLDAARLHFKYQESYPTQYHLLQFENLICQPAKEIERLCNFLEFAVEPQMLHEVDVVGSSFNSQRLVRTGFDRSVVDRWRSHISPWLNAWFLIAGRKYLHQFGYAR